MCVSGCHHRHRQASDNSSAVSGYIYFNRFHQQMINPSMALGWQRPGLQAEQLNTTTGLSMRESRKKMRVGMNEHRLLRLSGVTETAVQTVHEVGLTKETRVRERERKRDRGTGSTHSPELQHHGNISHVSQVCSVISEDEHSDLHCPLCCSYNSGDRACRPFTWKT